MIAARTTRNMITNGVRAFRRWIVPYAGTLVYRNDLRPLLSYLFTEWDCNMRCQYCYSYGDDVPGMTLETAKSSIDWLKTTGCRVVAIMGGEPLLRKEFILDVVRYGTEQGFFVYLPTNGVLLDEDYIDALGQAGVAAINLAVDSMDPLPGMPKALNSIEPQFRALVKKQRDYGYVLFLNMNITSRNLADIRQLTELVEELGIGADYHINERPLVPQAHYQDAENDTYIRPDQFAEVDDLVDWIIAAKRRGVQMVNTLPHLEAMKGYLRGENGSWPCLAGRNATCIRIDGTLSPCFGMYADTTHDWGRIWEPKFDADALRSLKGECMGDCLSTCQYNLGTYCSIDAGTIRWMWVHMATST